MNSSVSTAAKSIAVAQGAGHTASDTWSEVVAAMPIVIFYRAAREVLRQRAHKRAVLEAFRR
jgi:hypothetical protein